jgi:hypothetical protein
VGGGWALEIESFLGPVKWHRIDRRVPFVAQKHCEMRFSGLRIKSLFAEIKLRKSTYTYMYIIFLFLTNIGLHAIILI